MDSGAPVQGHTQFEKCNTEDPSIGEPFMLYAQGHQKKGQSSLNVAPEDHLFVAVAPELN